MCVNYRPVYSHIRHDESPVFVLLFIRLTGREDMKRKDYGPVQRTMTTPVSHIQFSEFLSDIITMANESTVTRPSLIYSQTRSSHHDGLADFAEC
jgi:hypothetical protein